ncbi:MAG: DUF2798 domain-containing protein [Oliverpabstia sp.]
MPQNKRESLIYTVLMCFCMVLWMSMYNVTLHMGGFSLEVLKEGWLGFPIAYVFAMCCDWFLSTSGLCEKVRIYLSGATGRQCRKKKLTVICVSCSMVVPMVLIMSMYGAVEGCVRSGAWSQLLMIWLTNIPKNFIMALPFQLRVSSRLTAGSSSVLQFPEGKGTGVTQHKIRESGVKRYHFPGFFNYASNAPKSMLVLDLGDCRDNSRNLPSVSPQVFCSLVIL